MNRYPLWKYLLILLAVVVGFIYALPNIYPADPSIQISAKGTQNVLDISTLEKAKGALDAADIQYFGAEVGEKNALIRLYSLDDQLRAQDIVQQELGDENYIVVVNLAATTPEWLSGIGAGPMKYGLDLAGGVHFLLEVDTPQLLNEEIKSIKAQLRKYQIDNRIRGAQISTEELTVTVKADTEEKRDEFRSFIVSEIPQLQFERAERNGEFFIDARLSDTFIREKETQAVQQNLTALRKRVDELNVSEPLIQRQGRNRIVVQLPGVQDTAKAKEIIGKTASLEFRLEARPDAPASGKVLFPHRDEIRQARTGGAFLERKAIIHGKHVSNAQAGFDQESASPSVNITLNKEGGDLMYRNTVNNVRRNLAVLFIEYRTETERYIDENGVEQKRFKQIPEKEIISLATIREPLNMRFQTTGLDSAAEASDIALLLRAGALAAPMGFVEERTIGPSLGKQNVDTGVLSVQIGLALVIVFMLVYYRVFGIAANIALATNLVLVVAIMSIFGATLTLPGIAGIVLTVGMAVDANVLIFSRIREEIKSGSPPQTAIKSGFDRAFTTILDANITTFIVAIILYAIGSGPVKGFAVTLAIGIVTSMFTAIMGTRALVNLIYGNRPVKKLLI